MAKKVDFIEIRTKDTTKSRGAKLTLHTELYFDCLNYQFKNLIHLH